MFQRGRFHTKREPPGRSTLTHSNNHDRVHTRYSPALMLSSMFEGYFLLRLKGGSAKTRSTESDSIVRITSTQSPRKSLPKLVSKTGLGARYSGGGVDITRGAPRLVVCFLISHSRADTPHQ